MNAPNSISPYAVPVVDHDGVLLDGHLLSPLPTCSRCADRRCRALYRTPLSELTIRQGLALQRCYKNVLAALVEMSGEKVVVPGIHTDAVGPAARGEGARSGRAITVRTLARWRDVEEQRRRKEMSLEGGTDMMIRQILHDVKGAVKPLVRNTEVFVDSQPGEDEEAKLASLSEAARGLVSASKLVRFRLLSLDIVANPAAAALGTKRPKRIFRLVDFFVHTLGATARSSGVTLRLTGRSAREVDVYDTFDAILLNLLDNAIKYARPGLPVEVEVADVGVDRIHIGVTSLSPYIPPDERRAIFDLGFRSEVAQHVAAGGSGFGLYIARIVAEAHGTTINLSSDDSRLEVGGVRYCHNQFWLVIS